MPRGTSAMHTFPAIVDYTILCVSPAAFEAIAGLRLLTLPTGLAPARRCNGFGTGAARLMNADRLPANAVDDHLPSLTPLYSQCRGIGNKSFWSGTNNAPEGDNAQISSRNVTGHISAHLAGTGRIMPREPHALISTPVVPAVTQRRRTERFSLRAAILSIIVLSLAAWTVIIGLAHLLV